MLNHSCTQMEDFNISYFNDFTYLCSNNNDDKFLTLKLSLVYKTTDYTITSFATNK